MIMAYDKELRGCFSSAALEFAAHPLDEDRAFTWMCNLRHRKVGLTAALQQVREFLESENASEEHIKRQLEKVTEHFKSWLLD